MSHRRRTTTLHPLTLATLLLACALTPAPAAAHGTCRDGEHTLADERALASFRTALDESCPCADYEGSAGRNRRDYRSCATDVLGRAQADGWMLMNTKRKKPATLLYGKRGTSRTARCSEKRNWAKGVPAGTLNVPP